MAITNDGFWVVLNSWDLWNRDEKLLHILSGHTAEIWGVSVHAEGNTIASGSNDNTVKLWPLGDMLQLDVLLNRKCAALRDYLANSQDDLSVKNRDLCKGVGGVNGK